MLYTSLWILITVTPTYDMHTRICTSTSVIHSLFYLENKRNKRNKTNQKEADSNMSMFALLMIVRSKKHTRYPKWKLTLLVPNKYPIRTCLHSLLTSQCVITLCHNKRFPNMCLCVRRSNIHIRSYLFTQSRCQIPSSFRTI